MTTLGYRRGGENIPKPRAPTPAPVAPTPLPAPSLLSKVRCEIINCPVALPRGSLPLLVYVGYAAALPLSYYYGEYDFSDDFVRAATIVGTTLFATFLVLVNDCCTWYNMILFLHIALEYKLLDTTMTYVNRDHTSDVGMAWAWVGMVVVVLHLLPFLLVDGPTLLLLLAFVGVPVNTALAVFLDPAYLPVIATSSVTLLLLTYVATSMQGLRPSMRMRLMEAVSAPRGCIL